ncbi:MAG: cell wall hydrolase [Pseudomonadota bacterium]
MEIIIAFLVLSFAGIFAVLEARAANAAPVPRREPTLRPAPVRDAQGDDDPQAGNGGDSPGTNIGPALVSAATRAREIDVTARTLWGEARGEGSGGMIAVARVIRNRVLSSRYPNTFEAVCMQRFQFSVWNDGGAALLAVGLSDRAFVDAIRIASEAVDGTLPPDDRFSPNDNGEVLHYLNPDPALYPSGRLPSWAFAASEAHDIGRHRFLRGVA